jgi:hypothetical protein
MTIGDTSAWPRTPCARATRRDLHSRGSAVYRDYRTLRPWPFGNSSQLIRQTRNPTWSDCCGAIGRPLWTHRGAPHPGGRPLRRHQRNEPSGFCEARGSALGTFATVKVAPETVVTLVSSVNSLKSSVGVCAAPAEERNTRARRRASVGDTPRRPVLVTRRPYRPLSQARSATAEPHLEAPTSAAPCHRASRSN